MYVCACLCVCVCVTVCLCVCVSTSLAIKFFSSMNNQLNKLLNLLSWFLYTKPAIDIVDGHGLNYEMHPDLQPKKAIR